MSVSINKYKQAKLDMLDDMLQAVTDKADSIATDIKNYTHEGVFDPGASIGFEGGPFSSDAIDKFDEIEEATEQLRHLAIIYDYLSEQYDLVGDLPDKVVKSHDDR